MPGKCLDKHGNPEEKCLGTCSYLVRNVIKKQDIQETLNKIKDICHNLKKIKGYFSE